MSTKRRQFRLKAVDTTSGGVGEFTAVVAVFDNVDDVGDRILPGAFTDTIKATGGIFPVVWSHDWMCVPCGLTTSAKETSEGLEVVCKLLIDSHETAQEIYGAMKAGVPLEFSFAYDIVDAGWVTENEQQIYELRKLNVLEVGPCLIGANRETHLVAVKSAAGVEHARMVRGQLDALKTSAPPAPSGADREHEGAAFKAVDFAQLGRYLATTPVD